MKYNQLSRKQYSSNFHGRSDCASSFHQNKRGSNVIQISREDDKRPIKQAPIYTSPCISSSAITYSKETVIVISDEYFCVTLSTENIGRGLVQIMNAPLCNFSTADVVVRRFAANLNRLTNVTKVLIRLGTAECMSHLDLATLWPPFPAFVNTLRFLFKDASLYICSVLPIEDIFGSQITRQGVSILNSWYYSLCCPFQKIYYLDFYCLFINVWGKNFGLFQDNVRLNESGISLVLQTYQKVLHEKFNSVHPLIHYK